MREIKFRAWNDRNSDPKARMMDFVHLTNLGLVIMPDGDTWPLPVMQFTGLKDKNGKEIYDGDVVKVMGEPGSYEVQWDDGAFVLDWHSSKTLLWSLTVEVIGNIHENPDLLSPPAHPSD